MNTPVNQDLIGQVCSMPRNQFVVAEANKHGLDVVNVMWEDTARTQGSCWGANITDMTLQVRHPGGRDSRSLLPVFRKPNFRDVTCDIPLDSVKLKVGNEAGTDLETVSLREYLGNLSAYVSNSSTYNVESDPNLVTDKDSHVLVSAQACVLPIPAGGTGKVEFNPVLMNYQSREDSPAVLTIMISPEGTSSTVLDNTHDEAEWGQNVYYNNAGQKTCLTGQRLSAYKQLEAERIAEEQGISPDEALSQVEVADDINIVIVIQVPLKHKKLDYYGGNVFFLGSMETFKGPALLYRSASFEDAVIGHGENEGDHFELGGYKLERDPEFPIRATVQFYKVSDTAALSPEHVKHMADCIDRVYQDGDYVGSLVDGSLQVGRLGMGEARPTQPAPQAEPVNGPPTDLLDVVSPFKPGQDPKA